MIEPTRPSTGTSGVARRRALEAGKSSVLPLWGASSAFVPAPPAPMSARRAAGGDGTEANPASSSVSGRGLRAACLRRQRRSQWSAAAEADCEVARACAERDSKMRREERQALKIALDEQVADQHRRRDEERATRLADARATINTVQRQERAAQRRSVRAHSARRETSARIVAESLAEAHHRKEQEALQAAADHDSAMRFASAVALADHEREERRRKEQTRLAEIARRDRAEQIAQRRANRRTERVEAAAFAKKQEEHEAAEAARRVAEDAARRRRVEERAAAAATAETQLRAAAATRRIEAQAAEHVERMDRHAAEWQSAVRERQRTAAAVLRQQAAEHEEHTKAARQREIELDRARCATDRQQAIDTAEKARARALRQRDELRRALEEQMNAKVAAALAEAEAA